MDTVNQGKDFEEKVRLKLEELYKTRFNIYSKNNPDLVILTVGNPPKRRKFDIVSEDKSIVVECKDNNWSETEKIPSGKIATILKEVLYFSKMTKNANTKKIIVLKYYYNESRKQTLADYFIKTYKHLLEDIIIMELNVQNMELKQKFPF